MGTLLLPYGRTVIGHWGGWGLSGRHGTSQEALRRCRRFRQCVRGGHEWMQLGNAAGGEEVGVWARRHGMSPQAMSSTRGVASTAQDLERRLCTVPVAVWPSTLQLI